MLLLCFFFVFIDTATTEIYTYGHTLSLHDALPIFAVALELGLRRFDIFLMARFMLELLPDLGELGLDHRRRHFEIMARGELVEQLALHIGARSEEHTSELQSLMRISYAVFCLKKKNINNIIIHILIHNIDNL